MGLFLDFDDLYRLTRKKQANAQKRVLKAKGYDFEEDPQGRPLVLRAQIESRILGTAARELEQALKPGPDSAALAALMGQR